jgi:hypothetical protein
MSPRAGLGFPISKAPCIFFRLLSGNHFQYSRESVATKNLFSGPFILVKCSCKIVAVSYLGRTEGNKLSLEKNPTMARKSNTPTRARAA